MPEELKGHRALWVLEDRLPADIRGALNGRSAMLSHLVYCRGYRTAKDIETFFERRTISHDPFLLPDMETAVARIKEAVRRREKVAVYGDFDCDGITSAALLTEVFRHLGLEVVTHIPEREAGHGLAEDALRRLQEQGVTLIVTADCGITAHDEVEFARSLGCDVIVTDHHEPHSDGTHPNCPTVAPTRPDSQYPWRDLCGVGVSYKLSQALRRCLPEAMEPSELLDLVAMGTVADVVPLLDENRSLVIQGLDRLKTTRRSGLQALLHAAGIEPERIDPVSVGYYLAPRINAANRIATPQLAYDLITAEDIIHAGQLAERLSALNRERQDMVRTKFAVVAAEIGEAADIAQQVQSSERCPVLFIVGGWPPGISGLLASKLAEMYALPSFVGSPSADGVIAVSARSVPGVRVDELVEAAHTSVPGGLFLGFGGHSAAAGFRVAEEQQREAERALEEQSRRLIDVSQLGAMLSIDAEVDVGQLDLHAAQQVQTLAPFGKGFPEPLFLVRGVGVRRMTPVGEKHVKLTLERRGSRVDGICFNADPDLLRLRPGSTIDAVFELQLNRWNGFMKPEFCLRDWRKAA